MEDDVKADVEITEVAEPERIRLLKVPIDILEPEALKLTVFRLAGREEEQHIVLLSVWDLLRARRSAKYRDYVEKARLVIPISKCLVDGARFLLGKKPVRYMPFDFVIRSLSALEDHALSIYMLGSKKRTLARIEKNIVSTYPSLRVVGRFPGSFRREVEGTVISAIRKASPSLLLVGNGVRGGESWLVRNAGRTGNGLRLWCSDLFDVLDGRRWRPSKRVFELGLEWIGYCTRSPIQLLRIFPFLYYNVLLLAYKARGKGKAAA